MVACCLWRAVTVLAVARLIFAARRGRKAVATCSSEGTEPRAKMRRARFPCAPVTRRGGASGSVAVAVGTSAVGAGGAVTWCPLVKELMVLPGASNSRVAPAARAGALDLIAGSATSDAGGACPLLVVTGAAGPWAAPSLSRRAVAIKAARSSLARAVVRVAAGDASSPSRAARAVQARAARYQCHQPAASPAVMSKWRRAPRPPTRVAR